MAILLGAEPYPAKVVGVSDGDTLTVLRDDKVRVKIRLHGIDAPELGQDFGTRAKQAASQLAFGREVTVRPRGTDKYGRTVAEVLLPDGRLLNHELVRSGHAWWYRKYAPTDRELERLEVDAREAKRGLWSQPGAVAPWEWRARPAANFDGAVIANKRSRVYHAPGCRNAAKIAESNRLTFDSEKDAMALGYRRGRDCHK